MTLLAATAPKPVAAAPHWQPPAHSEQRRHSESTRPRGQRSGHRKVPRSRRTSSPPPSRDGLSTHAERGDGFGSRLWGRQPEQSAQYRPLSAASIRSRRRRTSNASLRSTASTPIIRPLGEPLTASRRPRPRSALTGPREAIANRARSGRRHGNSSTAMVNANGAATLPGRHDRTPGDAVHSHHGRRNDTDEFLRSLIMQQLPESPGPATVYQASQRDAEGYDAGDHGNSPRRHGLPEGVTHDMMQTPQIRAFANSLTEDSYDSQVMIPAQAVVQPGVDLTCCCPRASCMSLFAYRYQLMAQSCIHRAETFRTEKMHRTSP